MHSNRVQPRGLPDFLVGFEASLRDVLQQLLGGKAAADLALMVQRYRALPSSAVWRACSVPFADWSQKEGREQHGCPGQEQAVRAPDPPFVQLEEDLGLVGLPAEAPDEPWPDGPPDLLLEPWGIGPEG